MKTKRNYSFVKASALLSGIIADVLTDMIKYQNSAIQDGIKTSTDIKGCVVRVGQIKGRNLSFITILACNACLQVYTIYNN